MGKEEKYPASDDETKKVGREEKKYKPSEPDTVTLLFKQSRTFELHIGNEMYRFEGREKKKVPASVLSHVDWTPEVAEYFLIKEA